MNHIPVLLEETINWLKVGKGKKYIDCTFGFGGHAKEILKQGGEVLGIDVDVESLKLAKQNFSHLEKLTLFTGNFRNLQQISQDHGFNKVSGVLFDLGMSSWQLNSSGRGFTFLKNEPLDMRMDQTLGVTAAQIIKVLNKGEIDELFSKLGEESLARDLGVSLIRARGIKEIITTYDLAKVVAEVYRKKYRSRSKKNPATKIFQALRIAVNDELNALKEALPQAVRLLSMGGRLVVISFHSLEDRIVKQFFRDCEELAVLTPRPIVPSLTELKSNPRARSAKLRVAEKINTIILKKL